MIHPTVSITSNGIASRHIRFTHRRESELTVLAEFVEPEHYFALSKPVPLGEVLSSKVGFELVDEFYFLFIPKDSLSTSDESQINEWVDSRKDSPRTQATATLELITKDGRLRWKPGCLVVESSSEWLEKIFPALVAFAFYEGQLRKLEQTVSDTLETAKNDIPLTHGVDKPSLKRQPHVNEMTYRATLSRMTLVKLQQRFDKPSSTLSGGSYPLFRELVKKAEVSDRLEVLEEELELVSDIYETANDRLTEFRYFHGEYTLEIWVIILLALEVVLIIFELLPLWFPQFFHLPAGW